MQELTSSDGTTLALHRLGGSGPTVLLIAHATGFASLVYLAMVEKLEPFDGLAVYGIDLRAHGSSDEPLHKDFSWAHYGEDVARAVDFIQAERTFGFGHSCGAASHLIAATTYGTRYDGLYLYEPIVFPPELQGEPDFNSPLASGAKRRRSSFASFDEAVANFSAKPPLSRFAPECIDAYVESCFRESPEGISLSCRREYEAATYAHGATHPTYQHLGEVEVPCVVAQGEYSDVFAPGYLRDLASKLPIGDFEVLPDVGHFAPMERPDLVAGFVSRWLERVL